MLSCKLYEPIAAAKMLIGKVEMIQGSCHFEKVNTG